VNGAMSYKQATSVLNYGTEAWTLTERDKNIRLLKKYARDR
jgi:hypothetical protein